MGRAVKIFIRNLMRQKGASILAIGSLSMGIAVTLLIGLWVLEEFGFDRFYEKGEHIYRVYVKDRDQKNLSGTFRQLFLFR